MINRASYFWWGTINHLMGVNSTDLSSGAFQTTSSLLKKLSMTTPFREESNKTAENRLDTSKTTKNGCIHPYNPFIFMHDSILNLIDGFQLDQFLDQFPYLDHKTYLCYQKLHSVEIS